MYVYDLRNRASAVNRLCWTDWIDYDAVRPRPPDPHTPLNWKSTSETTHFFRAFRFFMRGAQKRLVRLICPSACHVRYVLLYGDSINGYRQHYSLISKE